MKEIYILDTDRKPQTFVIGRKYHCSWAKSRGYVWTLKSFDESKNEAVLITPKTKKQIVTQLSSLREINKHSIITSPIHHINK